MNKRDKNKLDGKIQLRGLSQENILLYIRRHLEDKEKAESLMKAAERSQTNELLRIPIIALMLCILYKETKQLPRTQTEIIKEIIQIYIKRAKEKGVELPDEDEMLFVLGKLSWNALRRDTHQLLIKKVNYSLNQMRRNKLRHVSFLRKFHYIFGERYVDFALEII